MKILKRILLVILLCLLVLVGFFSIGSSPKTEVTFGVAFSQKHAESLGLDWKETYTAILDDLLVKNIKVASYWDLIEKEEGIYNFEDLDWQIVEAGERGVRVLLVLGMKTPVWPECHIPEWAKILNKEKQQASIIKLLKEIILRYKDNDSIWAWQVENEPLFPFGDCPWMDKEFLQKEIDLVKSLDNERSVLISDSGEGSFWFEAAKLGDIVGITMYRKVWFHELGMYITYPLPPTFYQRKAMIIKQLFGKEVMCVELQAEPWGPKPIYFISLEEQKKTMNLEQFKANIKYAKNTGFSKFYLWGAEWWFWMKEKQNDGKIWNEAKNLF